MTGKKLKALFKKNGIEKNHGKVFCEWANQNGFKLNPYIYKSTMSVHLNTEGELSPFHSMRYEKYFNEKIDRVEVIETYNPITIADAEKLTE
jgi:hypothetical protein